MSNPTTDTERVAQYMAKILKKPTGLATLMFRTFHAMEKAGFTEKQAMEITQWITMIAMSIGGMTD